MYCFSCEINDGQSNLQSSASLAIIMAVFTRENLFDLAKKITSPTNLTNWKNSVGIVLHDEVKTRFFLSSNIDITVDKDSFVLLPAVKSVLDYFCEETHKYWGVSKSDAKKCKSKHEDFFAAEIDISKLVESLDLTPLPCGDDVQAKSTIYRHADKIVSEFSTEAIFKAAHKKLKELGFVDAAFVWSELIKEPVDLGKKFRRAKTIDFDSLKPKIPRLSAGELILNNGLTVSTYKVPISSNNLF